MIDEIVGKINALGRTVVFLGDGVPVFKDYLEENLSVDHRYAPASMNKQRAASVACLGALLAENGKAEEARDHKPEYLRVSQAERERQEKERDFKIC